MAVRGPNAPSGSSTGSSSTAKVSLVPSRGPTQQATPLVGSTDASALPSSEVELQSMLLRVSDLNKVRQQLSAQIAEGSNLVKSLLLRAEDCRMMGLMCVGEERGREGATAPVLARAEWRAFNAHACV